MTSQFPHIDLYNDLTFPSHFPLRIHRENEKERGGQPTSTFLDVNNFLGASASSGIPYEFAEGNVREL